MLGPSGVVTTHVSIDADSGHRHVGFCARTRVPAQGGRTGDCNRDDSGALWLQTSGSSVTAASSGFSALQQCYAACEACARCRFMSLSSGTSTLALATPRLCTWHTHCDLNDLRTFAGEGLADQNWTTMAVRSRVPRPLPYEPQKRTAEPLQLAVATLAFALPHARRKRADHMGMGCALEGWCQGATRLRHALADPWRVSVVILYHQALRRISGSVPGEGAKADVEERPGENVKLRASFCPGADVLEIAEETGFVRAVDSCLGKLRERRHYTGMPKAIMLKWIFVGLTKFDAIFFADQDVDPLPIETDPSLVRRMWLAHLPIFLRSRRALRIDGHRAARSSSSSGGTAARGLHILSAADAEAPINTGMMLIRPSKWLYNDGWDRTPFVHSHTLRRRSHSLLTLRARPPCPSSMTARSLRVLRHCRCNASHGWGLVGRPREVPWRPRWFDASAGGSTYVRPLLDMRAGRPPGYWGAGYWFVKLNNTHAFKRNDWRFTAAAEDQGFFWYLCYLRNDVGAYFNPAGSPAHWVHHFWGQINGAKAWEGQLWNAPSHRRGEASPRLGANLEYLSRIEPSPTGEDSACTEQMRTLRRSAEEHPLTPQYATIHWIRNRPSRFAVW